VCLLLLDYRGPDWFLLAHRDERPQRATAPVHFWEDLPILAGRDLEAGGTWLAFGCDGRWVALTNGTPREAPDDSRSRGRLALDFLSGSRSPWEFACSVQTQQYAGFHLWVADLQQLVYRSNHHQPRVVESGTHVLGNAGLNSPGPREKRARGLWDGAERTPSEWIASFQQPELVIPGPGLFGFQTCTTVLAQRRQGRLEVWEQPLGQPLRGPFLIERQA
jgi:uncharacterized protein with NRDE domain